MTFDPFGDFEKVGYLQNRYQLKNLAQLQELEFIAVNDSLEEAFEHLEDAAYFEYGDVLKIHRILFEAIYPWAGQDRNQIVPDKAISKAGVNFAHPADIRKCIEYALGQGQEGMLKPGVILGMFAYGHPFLDGNGRTIMLIFTELLFRAGIYIDWSRSLKSDYLTALTQELKDPDKGHLDRYLAPLIGLAPSRQEMLHKIVEIKGLFVPLLQQH